MKLAEVVDKLQLKILTGRDRLDREVTGGYVCDLISDVMANSRTGQVWITLQNHVNVVAVASLRELAGVVLIRGRSPVEDALAKAEGEGLPLLQTDLEAFEICGRLHELLQQG